MLWTGTGYDIYHLTKVVMFNYPNIKLTLATRDFIAWEIQQMTGAKKDFLLSYYDDLGLAQEYLKAIENAPRIRQPYLY